MLTRRVWRDFCIVVAGSAGAVAVAILTQHLAWFEKSPDWTLYMDATHRWLATGAYFSPRQLDGPYQVVWGDVLYPPATLWLFVPFSFLPRLAWLAVPLTIIGVSLWRLRPAVWGWAAIGVLFYLSPTVIMELTSGNPLLWAIAALFASVAFGAPASLVLLKPTRLPFALFGIWRRSCWYGLGLLVLLSLPMLALDLTWLRTMIDARQPYGLLYSLHEMPCAAIPLVAWLASVRSAEARRATRTFLAGWRPRDSRRGTVQTSVAKHRFGGWAEPDREGSWAFDSVARAIRNRSASRIR
jgi:hypothetical protein